MGAPERKTVEETGQIWAVRLRSRMNEGQIPKFPYVSTSYESFLKLPRLAPETTTLRFDPLTGAIFTTRWMHLNSFEDEFGRRTIENPYNFTFFKENPLIPDPENLPKEGEPVGLVVMQYWDGIETAIRGQIHILDKYDPQNIQAEPTRLRTFISWIDQLASTLKMEKISPQKLENFSEQALALGAGFGFERFKNADKKKFALMLFRSLHPDQLGRVNPLISRIRLRSALLSATKRLVVSEFVRKKFTTNLEILMAEREFTRFSLQKAIDELSGLTLSDPWLSPPYETGNLRNQIGEISRNYLVFPKVHPYLLAARIAGILLAGREEKMDLNKEVLGKDVAEYVYSSGSAEKWLELKNATEAEKRIRWAKNCLNYVLETFASVENPQETI